MKSTIQKWLFLIAGLLVSLNASAYDFIVDGIAYNKNSDGNTVSVTYFELFEPYYSGDLIIPENVTYNGNTYTVTSIGSNALCECKELTSVVIPNSVKTIEGRAFYYCAGLKNITFGNSVETIGGYSFYGCISLSSVKLPDSVVSLESDAFSSCLNLTNIYLSNSLKTIGWGAFRDCWSLGSIYIPASVSFIERFAFSDCRSLVQMNVDGNNVTYYSGADNVIIERATKKLVHGCKKSWIPWDVTSIGEYAFYRCRNLNTLEIPASVTSIGNEAFFECEDLLYITIPESVTTIGQNAFRGCSRLYGINVLAQIPPTIDESFDSDAKVYVRNGCLQDYKNTLWCSYQLDEEGFIGRDSRFSEFDRLYRVNMVDNTIAMVSIRDLNVSYVNIPSEDVCCITKDIVYTCPVTSLGDSVFVNCKKLSSITIPKTIVSIGENIFENCESLEYIAVEEGNPIYDSRGLCNAIVETKTNTLIAGCKTTVIPYSVTSIGNYAFNGCKELATCEIPSQVTSIGNYAFSGCPGLTNISLESYSALSIGNYAFRGCSGLTNVSLGSYSALSIGNYAFSDCTGLTRVRVSNTLDSISNGVFSGCTALKSFIIVERSILENVSKENTIDLSSWHSYALNIGESAFESCNLIETINLPDSWCVVGNNAFRNCTNVKHISCPNSSCNGVYSPFEGINKTQCTLSFPTESVGDYLDSFMWAGFMSLDKKGVIEIESVDEQDLPFEECRIYFKNASSSASIKKERRIIGEQTIEETLPANTKPGSSIFVSHNGKVQFEILPVLGTWVKSVFYDGEDVTSQMVNNIFTTPEIKASEVKKLRVVMKKNVPSGVEENSLNQYNVFANEGCIEIRGAEGERVEVYSLSGQCIYSGMETSIPVEKGIYIVRVAGTVHKVII